MIKFLSAGVVIFLKKYIFRTFEGMEMEFFYELEGKNDAICPLDTFTGVLESKSFIKL